MKLKPWAAALVAGVVGVVLGVGGTVLVADWVSALPAPARSPDIAWQGWVGSFVGALIGAFLSAAVAGGVLFVTLRHNSKQFEIQQRSAAFDRAAAKAAMEQQARAEADRFREQMAAERELALEQHKLEAWGNFIGALRECIEFPMSENPLREIAERVASALVRWRMYLTADELVVGNGVEAVTNSVIGRVRVRAEQARPEWARLDPKRMLRDESVVELIVELQRKYEALQRGGAELPEVEAWFARWAEELLTRLPR